MTDAAPQVPEIPQVPATTESTSTPTASASKRPHIGLVAFYFPPSRASGVYRMLALANHLARSGWDVTVFTVTTDFFEHITMSSDETAISPGRIGSA